MSKVNCPCGNQLSDVACPSADKGHYISDEQLDDISSQYDSGLNEYSLMEQMTDVWVCRKCNRIAFENSDRTLVWYFRENDAAN